MTTPLQRNAQTFYGRISTRRFDNFYFPAERKQPIKVNFYIPRLHTKPLSDKDPHCAHPLNTLRQKLQALAGRPVNFQATNNLILYVRDVLLGQPYFILIEPDAAS